MIELGPTLLAPPPPGPTAIGAAVVGAPAFADTLTALLKGPPAAPDPRQALAVPGTILPADLPDSALPVAEPVPLPTVEPVQPGPVALGPDPAAPALALPQTPAEAAPTGLRSAGRPLASAKPSLPGVGRPDPVVPVAHDDPAPVAPARDSVADDDDLPEPTLEPSLAWLLPPAPLPRVMLGLVKPRPIAAPTPPAETPTAAQVAPGSPVPLAAADPVPAEPAPRAVPRPVLPLDAARPDVQPGTTSPTTPDRTTPQNLSPSGSVADRSPTDPPAPRQVQFAAQPAVPATPAPPPIAPPPIVRASTGAALAASRTPALPAERRDDAAAPAIQPATNAVPTAVVAPSGGPQAGLDLTRDPGLHRMIDRIVTLREAAAEHGEARDTRIRLIPDALGPIDIAVRRDGDAVSVHFTASEASAARLIADAQPRLNELADARGVRIDRTTVDTGSASGGSTASGSHPGSSPGQPRAQPVAPSVPSDTRTDSASPDDRIA